MGRLKNICCVIKDAEMQRHDSPEDVKAEQASLKTNGFKCRMCFPVHPTKRKNYMLSSGRCAKGFSRSRG